MQRKSLFMLSLLLICAASPFAQEAKRLPVPAKDAVAKSKSLIEEIFAKDIADANTSEAKVKLANYLLQQARESKDDNANRYTLYIKANQLACEAGDAALALLTAEEMGRTFEVQLLDLKVQTLTSCERGTSSQEAARALVDQIMPLIGDAVDADEYNVALELSKVALSAAKKAKSLPLVSAVERRGLEVVAVRKGFLRLEPYIERLKKNPKDAEASLELGNYYGLLKGKWEKALPMFAVGSDAALRKLAQHDLSDPQEAAQQLALADGWWDLAEKAEDPSRVNLERRARHWYEKAIIGLRGLNRTKAARRIDLVSARLVDTPSAEGPSGPVGLIHAMEGHTDEIKNVAISSSGRYAVSGGLDNTARVWDLTTGKVMATMRGHTKQIWGVDFHPDNRHVITASWDTTARLWDIKTGAEEKRFTQPVDVNGVAISRDGKRILVGCDNRTLYIWDALTGAELNRLTGPTGYVYAVAFAPDGRLVACGSVDKSVHIFDMITGQTVRVLQGHNNGITALAFSPDSKYIFSCGDRAAHQWEIATGKEVRQFEGHTGMVYGLSLSRDGRRLLTGGDDKTVRLWDVATGKQLHAFEGHTDTVNSVAISPDGRHAVSGGYDRTVRLWGLPLR